jgi:hypothetical protein
VIRLLTLAVVALGLAPGTWVRTEVTARDYEAPLRIIPIEAPTGVTGALELTGLWNLTSANDHHHGFSALTLLPNGDLLTGSDRGRLLTIPLMKGEPSAAGAHYRFLPGRGEKQRRLVDLEALTIAPNGETIWAAFENSNAIESLTVDTVLARRSPQELQHFSNNSGPETLQRLADGRFLVLAEGPEERGLPNRPGVLFDRDPTDPKAQSQGFRFVTPEGFAPVDATNLPDGTLAILLRRVEYAIPARFDGAIMVADPGTIEMGREWSGEIIARFGQPDLDENFEGIAFVPTADAGEGKGTLFLIADDNQSTFQRSLLARLSWPPMPETVPAAEDK